MTEGDSPGRPHTALTLCLEAMHGTSAHISLARASYVIKPPMKVAGYTISMEAGGRTFKYITFCHTAGEGAREEGKTQL